ncbi:ATP-binding protein [Treponema sp. OMZ 787]|uniref:AAA family ATPase n=1 Tax=Treponema sp. OMZ 787 TaxID=2563669 RepID=UPI0020A2B25E|nr:ATP-binding protein [Treponema sp. OMZ 787]UTC63039.1 ATP-binding protein [Treponema sp. OMZ 787]
MILEFSIANTFSISEKQTISFEAVINDPETDARHYAECGGKKILKLACIYGANAAGKTKMLEALQFYISFLLSSFTELEPNEDIGVVPFKFDPHFQNRPSDFELIFYIKDTETAQYIRYDYNIQLTTEKVLYESLFYAPKGQKKRIFERSESNKIKWGSDITGAKKILEDMTRPNCSVISTGAQIQHPLLKLFYDSIYLGFRGMVQPSFSENLSDYIFTKVEKDSGFKNILTNLLSASDIGSINNIQIISRDVPGALMKQFPVEIQKEIEESNWKIKKLMLNHNYNNTDYSLPLSLESAGTKKLMELSLPLYHLIVFKSVVLIDELESSLHQELIELFLDLFLEISDHSQLLFTTHNQDLLDSGLLRDDEVWFCYKTPEGNSVYNSITDYKGIRKEASRKKLYNADKFGALPNVNINLLKELFYAEKNRKNTK